MDLKIFKFRSEAASLFTLLFVLSSAFFPARAQAAVEYPWELRKDQDGIQVHTRKVEGSPILEYKALMIVDVPIDKAIGLFEQDEKMTHWFHQCTVSRLIREETPDRKVLYFVLDLPWPVSDRDAVYQREKKADADGVITYNSIALPHELPRKDGFVRIPYIKSIWRFRPLKDGRTEVFYQQHGNVGGHIPAALVNRLAVDIPFKSFQEFSRELKSPA